MRSIHNISVNFPIASVVAMGYISVNFFLTIRFIHPVMMTRYGCGAVRAQA